VVGRVVEAGGGGVEVFERVIDCFRWAVRGAGVIGECEDVLCVVFDGPMVLLQQPGPRAQQAATLGSRRWAAARSRACAQQVATVLEWVALSAAVPESFLLEVLVGLVECVAEQGDDMEPGSITTVASGICLLAALL